MAVNNEINIEVELVIRFVARELATRNYAKLSSSARNWSVESLQVPYLERTIVLVRAFLTERRDIIIRCLVYLKVYVSRVYDLSIHHVS